MLRTKVYGMQCNVRKILLNAFIIKTNLYL